MVEAVTEREANLAAIKAVYRKARDAGDEATEDEIEQILEPIDDLMAKVEPLSSRELMSVAAATMTNGFMLTTGGTIDLADVP